MCLYNVACWFVSFLRSKRLTIGITFDVDVVYEMEWVKERGKKQIKTGKDGNRNPLK